MEARTKPLNRSRFENQDLIMPTPRISVAMSVYNGERFLVEAIESVLAQSFTDFEFLILDDGSTDTSRTIIHSYATQDARIRPIIRDNRGLIVSLNQLLDEARAPIIARMDADDICLSQRFERQLAFLDTHPEYGVIGALTDDIDENGQPYNIPAIAYPTTHEAFLATIAAGEQLLPHPTAMMRKDIVLAAGGYHAAFRHCEDFDLWLRLSHQTKLACLPEVLLRYRHSPDQVSSRHLFEQQIGAATARIAHRERSAGRSDPTKTLPCLPPIDDLDALFAQEGISREVRAMVARATLYSEPSLGGEGFELLLQHLREGGSHEGMWRTVLRITRFGMPWRATRLAATLLSTRSAPGLAERN